MRPSQVILYVLLFYLADTLWGLSILEVIGSAFVLSVSLALIDAAYDDLWIARRKRRRT